MPLCAKCILMTEIGVYCGKECYEAVKAFQATVTGLAAGRKSGGFMERVTAFLKQAVIVVVIVGGVYAVFRFGFGASTPNQIVNVIKGWVGG